MVYIHSSRSRSLCIFVEELCIVAVSCCQIEVSVGSEGDTSAAVDGCVRKWVYPEITLDRPTLKVWAEPTHPSPQTGSFANDFMAASCTLHDQTHRKGYARADICRPSTGRPCEYRVC